MRLLIIMSRNNPNIGKRLPSTMSEKIVAPTSRNEISVETVSSCVVR